LKWPYLKNAGLYITVLAVYLITSTFSPASAAAPDWGALIAQYQALPAGALASQQALDEIHSQIPAPAGAPSSWSIIMNNNETPERRDYKRENGWVIENTTFYKEANRSDPLGLIWFRNDVPLSIAISNPIVATSSAINATINMLTLEVLKFGSSPVAFSQMESSIDLNGKEGDLTRSGKIVNYYRSIDGKTHPPEQQYLSAKFKYDRRFGIYIYSEDLDRVVDWRIENQPWNSQMVSNLLSPDEKQRARLMFARGFELYKVGDLIGAQALVQAGLKIDPGNALGCFTLAEIGRSILIQNPNNSAGRATERVYYQHTIDLAPDSPEAALAMGYLHRLAQ
jgi:hypothetical protein